MHGRQRPLFPDLARPLSDFELFPKSMGLSVTPLLTVLHNASKNHKAEAFLSTNDKWTEKEIRETAPFTIALKYLNDQNT